MVSKNIFKVNMVLVKRIIKKILVFLGFFKSKNIWPILSDKKKHFLIKNVYIMSSVETINKIKNTIRKKQKGAYMRFGDGDVYLMLDFAFRCFDFHDFGFLCFYRVLRFVEHPGFIK